MGAIGRQQPVTAMGDALSRLGVAERHTIPVRHHAVAAGSKRYPAQGVRL